MDTLEQKKAVTIAESIQQDMLDATAPLGTVLGSEVQLCERYGVGRDALREAIRILEFRGMARMRRGPKGGLVVRRPNEDAVMRPLAYSYLQGAHAPVLLDDARAVLTRIASTLAPLGTETDTEPLISMAQHTGNEALQAIVLVFEALCASARGEGSLSTATARCDDGTLSSSDSRAGRIARHLIQRIRMGPAGEGSRLGSEADLCARYDIGIPVARQVIRLLEQSGLIVCQRGRGNGMFLRTPGIEAVTPALASYLVSRSVSSRESWVLGQQLSIETVMLAASRRADQANTRSLEKLLDPAAPTVLRDAADLLAIDRAVDRCTPNPVLLAILEGLKAYSRLRNRDRDLALTRFATEHGPEFLASTRAVAHAILTGDCRGAGEAQQLKNQLFISRVIQRS